MKAILLFTLVTVINVILSTIRSLATIKGGKWVSATANAICYGFYPLIVMLTAKDTVTITTNMLITALANFVCVWVIKLVEEKAKKDKLWKVEMAIPKDKRVCAEMGIRDNAIPYHYNDVGSWVMFNCYCDTQKDTQVCKDIAKKYNGKISAYESKPLV